jgi:uncharacterized protein (DUF1330 family)
VDAAPEVVEGDPGLRSVVLMEFPDGDRARAWYESPAYRPLKRSATAPRETTPC